MGIIVETDFKVVKKLTSMKIFLEFESGIQSFGPLLLVCHIESVFIECPIYVCADYLGNL